MDKFLAYLDWYNCLRASGVLLTLYLLMKDVKIMKTDWAVLAKFFAFMMFVSAARMASMDYGIIPPGSSAVGNLGFGNFFWVFWEDALFALPIYYLKDYKKFSKKVWIPATIALSVAFAYGHMYYGWLGLIALLPPYFVSYTLGKKYGFGTVMVGHILYDFIGIVTLKLFLVFKLFMV